MRPCYGTHHHACGFTLLEVVFVIVILGVVSSIGAGFLVSSVDAYRDAQSRSVLVQRARLTLEQIALQIRSAVPNSVRVSSTGNCVEFLPVVVASNYQTSLPDVANNKSLISSINTGTFTLGLGQPQFVVVAPMSPNEVYSTALPGVTVSVGALSSSPASSIPLASNHRFLRNSKSQRVYVADYPKRICLVGSELHRYSQYGFLTSALTDGEPGGDSDLMAHNVAANGRLFTLSPGSENRNASLLINVAFSSANDTLNMTHEVLIRNVP